MLKKLSLLLCLPILWAYAAFNFLRLWTADLLESEKYSSVAQVLFQTLALSLFIVLALGGLARRRKTKTPSHVLGGYWLVSFLFILLEITALLFFVDPHARLGFYYFQPITFDARAIKAEFYNELPARPDIVVLGSSRAFTLSPSYIRQQTGYEAFNFSVEAGKAGDFILQLNFMLKSAAPPRVLIVDVSQDTLSEDFQSADLQPLALTPYMPASMRLSVFESILHDMTSVQSISDSAYLLAATGGQGRGRTWLFQEDGMGLRKNVPHGQYLELLKVTVNRRVKSMQCERFNPSAKREFERFIKKAQENNIGIVLYQSPVHAEFYYAARMDNPAAFDACRALTDEYFRSLAAAYPNVVFTNLLSYEPATLLGEEGFYDAVHLKPAAAQMIVDRLAPNIHAALAWALAVRH